MADPLERWVATGSCWALSVHHFIPQQRSSVAHRSFRCAICRLETSAAMVIAYRLGVEAMGGNGHAVAPSLALPISKQHDSGSRLHWRERERTR